MTHFAQDHGTAIPIHVLGTDEAPDWIAGQPDTVANVLTAAGTTGKLGQVVTVPGTDGRPMLAVAGHGDAAARRRELFPLGNLRGALPKGVYRFATGLSGRDLETAALSWLLSGYRFDRYRAASAPEADLVPPDGLDAERLSAIADGVFLTSDLINTPSNDMGPDELEAAVRDLATGFGATVDCTIGDALLDAGYPLIHAVGRASPRAPRLIDLTWGETGAPRVTLVGKGVCFDTGGLNLKPGASMGLMKKDMGGAATVLGLARMIMATGTPVRLRVLIPAVENAVSGASFRPGDILPSRKGLTVEINNTDAEGRLVLADALALACEDGAPDLLVCMATLTGAARVALGPEVVPYFTDDAELSGGLTRAAERVSDPLWPMPFWPGYETMIEPGIADLDNAPKGGMAGAITAALFLNRFVEKPCRFVHFDCYGWTPAPKPGRPKGGACQGARALFDLISQRYGS